MKLALTPSTLLVEIAPGKEGVSAPKATVPRFAIAEFIQLENGDLRVKRLHWSEWITLHQENLTKLGIKMDVRTVVRLGNNGYIRVRMTSPKLREMNLSSWLSHVAAVEADPNFWERRLEPVGFDEGGKVIWGNSLLTRRDLFDAFGMRDFSLKSR